MADAYFRAGADKVSIGSDAVDSARAWMASRSLSGSSAIETISRTYGRQAVVVSIDPRRVWVKTEAEAEGHALCDHSSLPDRGLRGPDGQTLCWYECTVQGGRAGSGLDVVQVTQAVEALGAGEILLTSMDGDGTQAGYDLALTRAVVEAVEVPVIASGGAGCIDHIAAALEVAGASAAMLASLLHDGVLTVEEIKLDLLRRGLPVRPLLASPAMA